MTWSTSFGKYVGGVLRYADGEVVNNYECWLELDGQRYHEVTDVQEGERCAILYYGMRPYAQVLRQKGDNKVVMFIVELGDSVLLADITNEPPQHGYASEQWKLVQHPDTKQIIFSLADTDEVAKVRQYLQAQRPVLTTVSLDGPTSGTLRRAADMAQGLVKDNLNVAVNVTPQALKDGAVPEKMTVDDNLLTHLEQNGVDVYTNCAIYAAIRGKKGPTSGRLGQDVKNQTVASTLDMLNHSRAPVLQALNRAQAQIDNVLAVDQLTKEAAEHIRFLARALEDLPKGRSKKYGTQALDDSGTKRQMSSGGRRHPLLVKKAMELGEYLFGQKFDGVELAREVTLLGSVFGSSDASFGMCWRAGRVPESVALFSADPHRQTELKEYASASGGTVQVARWYHLAGGRTDHGREKPGTGGEAPISTSTATLPELLPVSSDQTAQHQELSLASRLSNFMFRWPDIT
ncbi:MAG: hypothetical protein VXX04_05010, partial [Actinomycetota bacterium]|nr:hypothetical protein [Actinomycetota bacterium]